MLQINFFGDFVCTNVSKLSLSEDLNNILLKSDYNCLNFEAPLRSNTERERIRKSGPRLSMPDEVLDFISKNNFNIISLANNHIMDYGESGLKKTMCLLQDKAVGVGTYKEAYTPKIISKDGISVAFLSLTHREYGCVDVNSNSLGAAWILNPELPLIISKIKSGVDFLFVLAHAGVEYMDIPLPEWRSTYKLFIDWGVDCIIASHPHVPQGFEIYKDKYIYYSLGNFCFQKEAIKFDCNNRPYWNSSLMVNVKIDESKKINIQTIYLQYSQDNGSIIIDESDEIVKHMQYCNSLLIDENRYNELLDRYCYSLMTTYRSMFEASGWIKFKININTIKFFLRLFRREKKDAIHLINAFQCESHRWLINRILDKGLL